MTDHVHYLKASQAPHLDVYYRIIEENEAARKSIDILLSKEGNIDAETAKLLNGLPDVRATDIYAMRKLN